MCSVKGASVRNRYNADGEEYGIIKAHLKLIGFWKWHEDAYKGIRSPFPYLFLDLLPLQMYIYKA